MCLAYRKVEQVAEKVDSLKESLDKHLFRQQKRMLEVKERADLLARANGDSAHVLRIFDEEAQAMESARNSSIMLEEAYATGVAVLSKYSEQRDRLKVTQFFPNIFIYGNYVDYDDQASAFDS
ncbi:hypothetical protein ZIOFF_070653 [Zingiber officinale]|uniref:Uncharacterized protein n=1 Tax=Zingiber officinale TaxID=94328 RepID=A0A8J5C2S4_ZINOF|nr:hypothetical protein ZIOFF_070653 [Zingiber officinale]